MFILFGILGILLLVFLLLLMKVTVSVRFVFGPKEKSFRWKVNLLHSLFHWENNYVPREMIQNQVNAQGREKFAGQIRRMLRKANFWQVDAFALLGVGDAAVTALCCGLIDAAFNAVGAALLPKGKNGHGWRIQTTPSFEAKTLELQIHGIFRFRAVQIMLVALNWRKAKNRE